MSLVVGPAKIAASWGVGLAFASVCTLYFDSKMGKLRTMEPGWVEANKNYRKYQKMDPIFEGRVC